MAAGTVRLAAVPLPRRLRYLVTATTAVGALCFLAAVLGASAGPTPKWPQVLAALALVGLSRLVRLRLQFGSSVVWIDWSEAAIVVAAVLVDPVWLIITASVGVALANGWSRLEPVKLIYNSANTAFAATLAAVTLVVLDADSYPPLSAPGVSVPGAIALVITACIFWVLTDVGTAGAVATSRSLSWWSVLVDGAGTKVLMLVGNISVALAALGAAYLEPHLLLIAPPVLWLLHQAYVGRVNARDERRTWQSLAAATHALNHLDVRQVVDNAVTGAASVFCADVVEFELARTDDRAALTRGDARGNIWRGKANVYRPEPSVIEAPLPDGPDGSFGVLRLCFRSEVRLGQRERLALSTFADALDSALRNAEAHERLQQLTGSNAYRAAHDALTGLANRAYFLDAGGQALRAGQPGVVALLLLDFDDFKEVNDTLGHDAGDELLCRTADRMRSVTRLGEVLARLGGDEFALLMPGLPEPAAASREARRRAAALLATVVTPTTVGNVELAVEASVGVAVAVPGDCDIAELLRRAEIAMYQAKSSGRQVVDYDAVFDDSTLDRLALASEMQSALETDGQIVLNLQPSIDLATGAPLGAEALVRWQHPRRGLIGPADFIQQIEQTELIGPLTRHVLDMALAISADWARSGCRLPLAVNLSARALVDQDLPDDVAALLHHHGVPPDQLVLEITETAMMRELDVVEAVMNTLRDMGVQLSLDDFGTGYSSLTLLNRVKVDEVKIDKGFVAEMHSSLRAAAIVRTTVELARSLGLRVVAEGVENAEQRAALAALGCHGAQGYHLYPPMRPEKARAAIAVAQAAARTAPGVPDVEDRPPTTPA